MARLYTCLTAQHDLRLVAVACVICLLGTYACAVLCRHARDARGSQAQLAWTAGAAGATSMVVWATHFLAMLAFEPGMSWAIQLVPTAASLLAALVIVFYGAHWLVTGGGLAKQAFGGLVIGLGIGAMHHTGMAGYRVTGELSWNGWGIAASVGTGALLGACAGASLCRSGRAGTWLFAVLMAGAVLSTHFGGMASLAAAFDPRVALPTGTLPTDVLSVLVTEAALLILGLALLAHRLELRDARRNLLEQQRMCDLADVALEGLVLLDGERITGVNRSLASLLSSPREALLGRTLDAVLPLLSVADVPHGREADHALQLRGEVVPVRVIAQTLVVGRRPLTVVAVRDQRERLRSEEVRRLAFSDALTGLPNRARHNDVLAARCAAGRAGGGGFALLALDLDRFKSVNDTLGHDAGDAVLRQVADRLRSLARPGHFVARLGGDEFMLLAHGLGTAERIRTLAEQVVELLGQPYLVANRLFDIGASVGIAFHPSDGTTPGTLGRKADMALLRAKAEGKGRFRLFEGEMNDRFARRRQVEAGLRRALLRGEFELRYQPQVAVPSRAFDGAEALVRWRSPDGALVLPGEFIPVAEDVGLIGPIGEWVLRRACRDAAGWPDQMRVAVNLSAVQIRDPALPGLVAEVLRDTGLPGSRLELEITESVLMNDAPAVLERLQRLRAMGIRLSLDDFGTGFSSLSYLRKFPFDKIKIDRSFVQQAPLDPGSAAILRAVATMGASLGMATNAECVETAEQMRFITAEGCTQAQGYLFSRPVPHDKLVRLLAGETVSG